MLMEKLSETLEHSVSYSELAEAGAPAVDVTEDPIEVNDNEVLILHALSSLEQNPACDVR